MIQVSGLTYRYPAAERPALTGIDVEIPDGQLCAVVGANGAGKSTLCYALTGYVPHYFRGRLEGSVQVDGLDIPGTALAEIVGRIGLVGSDPFNQITGARFTVAEEIAFGLENLGVPRDEMLERTQAVMARMGILETGDRSPFELSGGQQQRLAIAAVAVMRPAVLVLDEPTSQLDTQAAREVLESLEQLADSGGTTVVIVEHKLEWLASHADRVLVLDSGRLILDGPPEKILGAGVRGLRAPIYAQVAAAAGFDRPLPVTLEQARERFA